ncbi:MAG: energy transducer TonB, partial [Fibrobacterota bacterium]
MFKAAVLNLFAVVMLVSATEIPPQEDSVVTLDTLTAANENEPSPDTLPPSQTKPESVQKDSSKAGIEVSATAGTPVARESDSVSVSGDTVTLGQAESATVPEDTLESGEADTLVSQQGEELVDEEVIEEEGGLEKMPELTTFVEAEYPRECIREGIEGVVLLELLVNEEGKVDSAAVVNGVHPLLDSSAAEAARAFLFSPAVAGGEDVAVMLQYEYRFSLREAVSTPDAYVNFTGRILERGTRKPIEEAMVVVEFLDTLSDTSLGMPFSLYLEQIAKLEGQSLEEG